MAMHDAVGGMWLGVDDRADCGTGKPDLLGQSIKLGDCLGKGHSGPYFEPSTMKQGKHSLSSRSSWSTYPRQRSRSL